MDIKEQLKDIKTQLRLSMNGAVSQSMREKGLVYKLNFGVELPRIKMIAEGYEKNHDLAQALWKEEIRECKILAGMLQPIETFYPEIADIWVENIRNIEIAELTCMNLFQHLPYAPAKSFHWIADEQEYVQTRRFVRYIPTAIIFVMLLCWLSANICSIVRNMLFKYAAWWKVWLILPWKESRCFTIW